MNTEEWKPIPNTIGYEASTLGRIRSPKTILKPQPHTIGYQIVGVRFEGSARIKTCTVHSLIAMAFIGPRPTKYVVAHRNHDKQDNRPDNLHYQTYRENQIATLRDGARKHEGQWCVVEVGESFTFTSKIMNAVTIRRYAREVGSKHGLKFSYDAATDTVTRLA